MSEYAIPLITGLALGILTGGAVAFWIMIASVRELQERAADRLENVAATVTAWSLHAEQFDNLGLASSLQQQADTIALEAQKVRKAL